MMIHDFDMARFLLGEEPIAVSAMGSALVDKAIGEAGDIDTAVVVMETKSGKVAQISNSRRATYGYDQRVEAHGSKGMIQRRQHSRDDGRIRRRARLRRRQDPQLLPRALRERLSQRARRLRRRGQIGRQAEPGRRGRPQGQSSGRRRPPCPGGPSSASPSARRACRAAPGEAYRRSQREESGPAHGATEQERPPRRQGRQGPPVGRFRRSCSRAGPRRSARAGGCCGGSALAFSLLIISVSAIIFVRTLVRIDPQASSKRPSPRPAAIRSPWPSASPR